MKCRFKEICEELERPLTCENQDDCEHYGDYLEGLEIAYCMDD